MEINIKLQNDKLEMANIDKLSIDGFNSDNFSKHGTLLPNTIRCIISGPSNCGKTNVVFNLLTQPNGLKFNNVYVFSKSLNQPKYKLLDSILKETPEVNFYKYNENDDIMEPNQAKPYSVFIFDDVACENHNTVRSYFAMGRHNNIDSVYIGQTYSKIPKQLIRDNVNLMVIFRQDDTNLKHIYSEHVGTDMEFSVFKVICGKAWEDRYGFLVISKDQPKENGRYRIGFDKFITLRS
jgi:hypothetical protein